MRAYVTCNGVVWIWNGKRKMKHYNSREVREMIFFSICHMFVTAPAVGKFVTTFWRLKPSVSNLFVTDISVSKFLTDFLSN
jgi:hypothetical protein